MDVESLRTALERFLSRSLDGDVTVAGFEPLAGGASREMFSFDLLRSGHGPLELVLRLDPPAGRMQSDRGEEYRLLELAHDAGVTVPRVRWLGGADDGLGARFLVMDRVRGEAIARRLLREPVYERARAALPAQLARELARIHAMPLDDVRLRGLRSGAPGGEDRSRFARAELERYLALLDAADAGWPRPALRFAARWLEANVPEARTASVVHGDFRVGNVMFDENGLTAVLDWELAHVGDPLEDVGWLTVRAWRFGRDDLAVGGLCSREAFWGLYAREAGVTVDPRAARWWEIFGNWKWAVICVLQAASHTAGSRPNVELAVIGRRTAEVEWELLSLLEECDAAGPP